MMQIATENITINELRAKAADRPYRLARLGALSLPVRPVRALPPPLPLRREPQPPRKIEIRDCEPASTVVDVAVCRSDVVLVLTNSAKPGAQFIIDPQDYRIELAKIVRVTARYFGVRVGEVLSHSRIAEHVHARQVAMYLAKTETVASHAEIGRHFRGRDQSTIKHAIKKIGALALRDADLARNIEELTTKLAGGETE